MGSVPTAYIVVRAVKGEDIRDVGSHNVGALNAYRRVGLWAGLTVLLVDAAKGVLAVTAPRLLGIDDWALFITTPLVVAGHNWPVFLNFRGGKGAAAIFGISLVIVPWLTVHNRRPQHPSDATAAERGPWRGVRVHLVEHTALGHRPRRPAVGALPGAHAVGHRHLRAERAGAHPKLDKSPAMARTVPRTSRLGAPSAGHLPPAVTCVNFPTDSRRT